MLHARAYGCPDRGLKPRAPKAFTRTPRPDTLARRSFLTTLVLPQASRRCPEVEGASASSAVEHARLPIRTLEQQPVGLVPPGGEAGVEGAMARKSRPQLLEQLGNPGSSTRGSAAVPSCHWPAAISVAAVDSSCSENEMPSLWAFSLAGPFYPSLKGSHQIF